MTKQLYYAEVDIITDVMRSDRKLKIISDGALFVVTDGKHKSNYYLDWHSVSDEAIKAYDL
jgi:hypothetical protein